MKTVQMLQTDLTAKLAALVWLLRKVGPYLAIEILMPGGTLIAIALFLYRRRNAAPDGTTLALRAFAERARDAARAGWTRLGSAVRVAPPARSEWPFALVSMRELARTPIVSVGGLSRVRAIV